MSCSISLETSHFSELLPAVVSRQPQFLAGYCEAVPEGLVKQDGWLSLPRAFPRSGRQLQLLIRCWSTPLPGLCRVRFKTLHETLILRIKSRMFKQNWKTYVQHLVSTSYVYCILIFISLFKENTNLSGINSIVPTWTVTTNGNPD